MSSYNFFVSSQIPIFSKNSNNSVASLFEARKFYEDSTIPFITSSYIEFVTPPEAKLRNVAFTDLYLKNNFYGLVDKKSDVIVPINNPSFFKSIGRNKDGEILVLDFVADAFNEMKDYLNRQIIKNAFPNTSPYFNIKPRFGYENPDQLYIGLYSVLSDNFRSICLKDKKLDSKITNEETFNEQYIKFLSQNIAFGTVTKTRTVMYFNMTAFTSGIMFNFNTDDVGDDVNKYLRYFLDDGFICFSEACARFGFVFDKHLPFVLTADLASEALRPYYQKYGLQSIDDVFEKRFKKVYMEDIDELKKYFYESYKRFLVNNTVYGEDLNKLCSGNANTIKSKVRNLPTKEYYYKKFPDTYWMRLYIYFKNLELDMGFTQQQFENIVKISNDYIKLGKLEDGLKFANSRFNELKGSRFYDSLQNNSSVVQSDSAAVGTQSKPKIIF